MIMEHTFENSAGKECPLALLVKLQKLQKTPMSTTNLLIYSGLNEGQHSALGYFSTYVSKLAPEYFNYF
ncbi:hypothetical protein XELAEV_18021094mg [Xenopus laevis]|uniref:Uncharacterized protein n=1 Tax=Xenopus laevis TaxID=8355 RepID=A0A974HRB7_XENLA|nr:hypothetical protein XELAEV_18021094mg [Xenopus laevis]